LGSYENSCRIWPGPNSNTFTAFVLHAAARSVARIPPQRHTRAVPERVVERIAEQIGSWPGVTVASHGPAFVEFRVGRRELGHLHGNYLADLPFPVRIREQLVAAGKGTLHHAHPASGWISIPIRDENDLVNVVSLFRFNYERPWLRPSAPDAR
jgi:hypothetical protein